MAVLCSRFFKFIFICLVWNLIFIYRFFLFEVTRFASMNKLLRDVWLLWEFLVCD